MQGPMFSGEQSNSKDVVANGLANISQNILVIVFGVLPLFFIPSVFVQFDYTKTFFVIVGIFLALIFFSLSALRSGTIRLGFSLALIALWGMAVVASISALLSGDIRDSFIGNSFDIHSALFIGLLALIATVIMVVMGNQKANIMRMYILLTISALVLGLFHVFRIIIGTDILSLGVFGGTVSTPLGSWNDLALFFGLTLLLSLVALEQLSLTKWGRVLFGAVIGVALLMLVIVNFFAVWIVLALVSLVVLIYGLSKERLGFTSEAQQSPQAAIVSTATSAIVFVVSILFIIGGSAIGSVVSNITNVSYVEVKPSLEATVDIARGVYEERAVLGIGPNKFVDAWRLYKDPSINTTIFWETNFISGSGYFPTFFVNTGVLGVVSVVAFLILFMILGLRMLLNSAYSDKMWYFIGTSSFVSALYIFGMSIIYVPSSTMLMLGALMVGLTFAAHNAVSNQRVRTFTLTSNRRAGFVLVGVTMIIIIGSVSVLYYTGRHYASTYTFAKGLTSLQEGVALDEVERQVVNAYALSENDVYARQIASYQLARMNALLGIQQPTAGQQQVFQNALVDGVNAAQLAVDRDSTEPINWATLGSVYSTLTAVGIDGSYERAKDAFTHAREFDPQNPTYVLLEAQLESRTNNLEEARALTQEAIQLRPNYSDALFFLSQIDIATGDVDGAVSATEAVIQLEPQNPARYYQLGVLESSRGNVERAVTAFEFAIERDENFANARYFLALAYVDLGRIEDAITQLEAVEALNPDNASVSELVSQLRNNGVLSVSPESAQQISEPEEVSETEGGQVTAEKIPDTPLITPINPGNEEDSNSDSATSKNTTDS